MPFSDFVENVIEAPICCELKQHLDTLYELYTKDPEKCALYLTSILRRGSAKSDFLMLLPLLLTLYNDYIMKAREKNNNEN